MVLREYRDRESLGSNRIHAFDIIRIGKSDILIENEILSSRLITSCSKKESSFLISSSRKDFGSEGVYDSGGKRISDSDDRNDASCFTNTIVEINGRHTSFGNDIDIILAFEGREDEEVSSKEQEVSSFLTPKRRGLSPTLLLNKYNRRSQQSARITTLSYTARNSCSKFTIEMHTRIHTRI